MTATKKLTAAALAIAIATTSVATFATPAEAANGRRTAAVAGALFGLAAGALLAGRGSHAHEDEYYTERKVCTYKYKKVWNGYRWVNRRKKGCWWE